MDCYVHVGLPKCGSTWLQRHFFPVHPQLGHWGRARGDEIISDDLRLLLWSDLIEKPEYLFDLRKCTETVQRLTAESAHLPGRVLCGVSHELLTHMGHGRVDVADRARRLKLIFGGRTKILIVIRNQMDWIVSCYKGLLHEGGLTLTFEEFLEHFFHERDRSQLSMLFFDRVFEMYQSLFGNDNVAVVPYEMLKGNGSEFVRRICAFLGVDFIETSTSKRENASHGPDVLGALLHVNRQFRYNLGDHPFHRPWAFTVKCLFDGSLGVDEPPYLSKQQETYSWIFKNAAALPDLLAEKGVSVEPMDVRYDIRHQRLLVDVYAEHNRRLAEMCDLPLKRLGYLL